MKISEEITPLEITNKKSNEIFKRLSLANYSIPEKLKAKLNESQKINDNINDSIGHNTHSVYNNIANDKDEDKKKLDSSANKKIDSKKQQKLLVFIISLMRVNETLKEMTYLIKPLINLLNTIKFGRDSSIPLIVNLLIDIIISRGKNTNQIEGTYTQKYLYNLEQKIRAGRYIVYFIRNPVLKYITLPVITRLMRLFRLSDSFIQTVTELLENAYLYYLIN